MRGQPSVGPEDGQPLVPSGIGSEGGKPCL
jgi:hypothetical protein